MHRRNITKVYRKQRIFSDACIHKSKWAQAVSVYWESWSVGRHNEGMPRMQENAPVSCQYERLIGFHKELASLQYHCWDSQAHILRSHHYHELTCAHHKQCGIFITDALLSGIVSNITRNTTHKPITSDCNQWTIFSMHFTSVDINAVLKIATLKSLSLANSSWGAQPNKSQNGSRRRLIWRLLGTNDESVVHFLKYAL